MAAIRSTMPLRLRASAGFSPLRQASKQTPLPRQLHASRGYATSPAGGTSGGSKVSGTNVVAAVAVLLGGGAGFYFYNQDGKKDLLDVGVGKATSKLGGSKDKIANQTGIGSADDYQRVRLILDFQLCHLD
jgi:hypothetical protein